MEYEEVAAEIEDFIEKQVEDSGAEGVVVGLSGGLDSATSLQLAVNALGREKVHALIMPGNPSLDQNMKDARQLAEQKEVETEEINISQVSDSIQESLPFELDREASGNVRARTRMIMLYAKANTDNLLVLGTGNKTEYLLGYFTKYGDGATDILPLKDLYKTEVRRLAESIGVDSKFIEKKPTAGLWKGQTDEDEIGMTYEEMDSILRAMAMAEFEVSEVKENMSIEDEKVDRIHEMYSNSAHKRNGPQGLELN